MRRYVAILILLAALAAGAIDTYIGVPGGNYGLLGQPRQAFLTTTSTGYQTVVSGVAGQRIYVWSVFFSAAVGARHGIYSGSDQLAEFNLSADHRQFLRAPDDTIPLFVTSAGADLRVISSAGTPEYSVSCVYSLGP